MIQKWYPKIDQNGLKRDTTSKTKSQKFAKTRDKHKRHAKGVLKIKKNVISSNNNTFENFSQNQNITPNVLVREYPAAPHWTRP